MSERAHQSIGRESTRTLLRYAITALVVGSILTLLLLAVDTPSTSVSLLGPLSMLGVGLTLAAALTAFIMRTYKRQMSELNAMGDELAGYTQLLEQNANLLERAQSVANIGSWFCDLVADEITTSAQGCKILGIPSDASTNYRGYMALVHEDDRLAVAQAWQTALKNGTLDIEHRIIVHATVRWVRQKAEVEYAPDATPVSALGIVQDITARKLTQLALKASEERYRTLIEWTPEAILVHRNTHIMYANPSALKLFGAPNVQSLLRKRTTDLIHPDDLPSQMARMERIQRGEPLPPSAEARFLKLDGSPIDVEVQGTAIEFDGEPAIHVSIRDITLRKHLEREIRQLAFYDSLTALPNRRLLDDRLSQAISANRRSGHFGALMFLDLDNFKPLNDRHGHAVGDLLLAQAAIRLKACIRGMDTVARFGGDEFVVLLTELDADWQKARQFAQTVAKKINTAMASAYSLPVPGQNNAALRIKHQCTASIGVVVFASANADAQELTKWADAAMYQAKNEGRNRICFSEHSAEEVVSHYFFDSSFSLIDKG